MTLDGNFLFCSFFLGFHFGENGCHMDENVFHLGETGWKGLHLCENARDARSLALVSLSRMIMDSNMDMLLVPSMTEKGEMRDSQIWFQTTSL